MSRTIRTEQTGQTVQLDYLSSLFIVLGFSLALLEAIIHVNAYNSSHSAGDIYVTVASVIFAVMSVGSLGLHGALCGGNQLAHDFSLGNTVNLLTFLFGVVAVYIAQVIVLQFVPLNTAFSSVGDSTAFYVSASIGEEMFFRYFLQVWIKQFMDLVSKTTKGFIIKATLTISTWLAVSAGFMLYHIGVYGTSEQGLLAVFGGSIVLCAALDVTKRISVTQSIHVWVDLVSAVASVIKL